MACEEMQLYYAYLDAVEDAKRKAQPWECEVTLFPADDEPSVAAPVASTRKPAKPAKPVRNNKSAFACDEPE
jgi:hypothetical protein